MTDSETVSIDDLAEMQAFVDEHGYLSWLGVTVESASPGRAEMSVPYREELTNPAAGGAASLHGGIPATLIDTVSAFALRTTFADPGRAALTTTDLDISYLRPATADLHGVAEVVRAGRSVGVTRVTVHSEAPDGKRKEVAIGTTTYRLFREQAGENDSSETSTTHEGAGR